jgi:transcriptional antiterminator RfaH
MSFRESDTGAGEGLDLAAPSWLLAYTRPRMEQTALVNLERQGFEVYLPLFKTCRRTVDALQPCFEAMFPRYVFLRARNQRQSLAAVASTRGVCSLVRFGGEAAQVSPDALEKIREFERQRKEAELDAISPIQPGAKVRVRKGALKGIEGLVVSVARQRVTFLLEMLGRDQQVTVAHGELELA